jgi:hypothetical protein
MIHIKESNISQDHYSVFFIIIMSINQKVVIKITPEKLNDHLLENKMIVLQIR